MQLMVIDENGCTVANVEADARSVESLELGGFAHVTGTFVAGPGFS